jgi:hypothetical protein
MEFDGSRLRRGELIAGGGAVVLLGSLFLLPWYGVTPLLAPTASSLGRATSFTGWDGLSHLRWLVLLTGVLALALVWFQGANKAPAVPVSLSVILTAVALLDALALVYRVLINVPGANSHVDQKAGAFVGLVAAIAIFYCGYRSMREEGLSERDARTEIETVELGPTAPGSPPAAS